MRVQATWRRTIVAAGLLVPLCLPGLEAGPQAPSSSAERPLPDLATFFAAVRGQLEEDRSSPAFTWIERETEIRFDGEGQPSGTKTKVYEVYPAEGGAAEPYRRLIARNGVPVPLSELTESDRKQQARALKARRGRESEESRDRARRLARDAEERRERGRLIDDVFRVVDPRLLRREWIAGRPTIVLAFTGRPGAKAATRVGSIAQKLAGTVWVDEEDLEPIRIEAHAVGDIDYGFGMFARVYKGTTAVWERQKIGGQAWLPTRLEIRANARVMMVRRLRILRFVEYSDYRVFRDSAALSLGVR